MINLRIITVELVYSIVMLTQLSSAQNENSGLEIHSSTNVQFLVVDPLGRKTGCDGETNRRFRTIPSSIYDTLSTGNSDTTQPNNYSRECLLGFGPDTMVNGNYFIKVYCLQSGSFWLDNTVLRVPQSLHQSIQQVGSAGQIFLYRFIYNYDISVPLTLDTLMTSKEIRVGIFNPGGTSILSVRAKPTSSFGPLDTLVNATTTIRWQARYPLTLGSVSSPVYGLVAVGSVVTQGNYKYQKFTTTLHTQANWAANTEYELFTVPVNGSAGVEEFGLTNALVGGTISIQIDNIERADTTFYQPVATCTGLTSQNKADNSAPTAFNGARHLAMTSTKLHEVYNSGGEIVYRRKSLTGSWETTQRISSDMTGSNNDPNIIIAHDGSIHVVWQQQLAATSFALRYNRSTDGGSTWGRDTAVTGASNVSINQNQWNIYPVIAEYGSSQIVVVCCYSGGLEYNTSSNLGQSWNSSMTSTGAQGGYGYSSYIWYPSLARLTASNNLIVTYDSRYNGVWSQVYNGTSWTTEACASAGVGTYYDRYSSVAFDWDLGVTYGSWCAQGPSLQEYGIVFRVGGYNNTWGSQFVVFPVATGSGISDFYPSITGWISGDAHNIDIVYNNSNNNVKLDQYSDGNGVWQSPRLLSTTGYWTNTSLQEQTGTPSYPIRVWTDQSGNPFQVTLQTDGTYTLSKPQGQPVITSDVHRRIVLESQRTRSTISFDLAPLKIVTTTNDTIVIPFKPLDIKKPFTATIANAWDYLGTDPIALPTNARSLIVDTDIRSQARQDTLGTPGTNIFTSNSIRLDGVKASQTVPLLSNQPGLSGRKVIDVSKQAGQAITLRMVGTVPATATERVTIGIGDVYITRNP
jgi:hypothetical protein